jgi:DNA-binding NarL/FixJ family response regulator
MINIILADDHNIVRNGIKSLLSKDKELCITGEGTNGKEVLDLIKSGTPVDVILSDMNMPEMNGADLIAAVKQVSPKVKVVILSMIDHEKHITHAFQAGAKGYLLKDINPDEMIFALKHVHGGGRYVCTDIAFKMLDRVSYNQQLPDVNEVKLSGREIEVLLLIAEGLTNAEIAEKMFTSKRTVEGHRQSLIDKTGSRNTAALIKYAVQSGLIK